MHAPLRCLQKPPAAPEARPLTDTGDALDTAHGSVLVCARCRLPITNTSARIEVGGAHAHVRENPDRITFRFGCFAHATGCQGVGRPSPEWTWFPGYTWQVEDCAGCAQHLGWLFRSPEHRFHGLVLERLAELDLGHPPGP